MSAQSLPVRALQREASRGTVKEGVGVTGGPGEESAAKEGEREREGEEQRELGKEHERLGRLSCRFPAASPGASTPAPRAPCSASLHPPLPRTDAAPPSPPRDRKWRHL